MLQTIWFLWAQTEFNGYCRYKRKQIWPRSTAWTDKNLHAPTGVKYQTPSNGWTINHVTFSVGKVTFKSDALLYCEKKQKK